MNNLNIFCFGFDQVAKCFIKKLKLENFNINLSTTSRENTHKKKFDEIDYTSFKFKGANYDNKLIEKLKTIEMHDIESEMLKNFYKDSKKVCNKKMKDFFDYTLKFPTYLEGLNYIRNNLIKL